MVLITFASAVALAGPKIKQIDSTGEKIAVANTKETTIGSEWIVSLKSGEQCSFEVTSQNTKVAILETDDCNFKGMRVGQRIEKSLFDSNTSAGKTQASSKNPAWMKKLKGFSVVGFFSFAEELPYTSGNNDITAQSETAFGFVI
ncbi:MAG: hypothetical protein HRT44_10915 [Bdellovibrionales bacterium]|nr:hypothetical protein [Bdellovibrionales bacterium]NQZ19751.1 hypothetical protein [Bdellovibrionales bacterium]